MTKISRNDPALAHAMAEGLLSRECDTQLLRLKQIKQIKKPLVRGRKFFNTTGGTVFERIDKEHGTRAKWIVGGIFPHSDAFLTTTISFARGEYKLEVVGVFKKHLVARIMQRNTGSDSLDEVLRVLRPCATVMCSLMIGEVDTESVRLIKCGELSKARLFVRSGVIFADLVDGQFIGKTWIAADTAADPELRRQCAGLPENDATIQLFP